MIKTLIYLKTEVMKTARKEKSFRRRLLSSKKLQKKIKKNKILMLKMKTNPKFKKKKNRLKVQKKKDSMIQSKYFKIKIKKYLVHE